MRERLKRYAGRLISGERLVFFGQCLSIARADLVTVGRALNSRALKRVAGCAPSS